MRSILPAKLAELSQAGVRIDLVDVRTPAEFREVHVAFARNVPLDQLDPTSLMRARSSSADEPFVGAGLVFAGITDICGMGMLLARMPWNRCRDSAASACGP